MSWIRWTTSRGNMKTDIRWSSWQQWGCLIAARNPSKAHLVSAYSKGGARLKSPHSTAHRKECLDSDVGPKRITQIVHAVCDCVADAGKCSPPHHPLCYWCCMQRCRETLTQQCIVWATYPPMIRRKPSNYKYPIKTPEGISRYVVCIVTNRFANKVPAKKNPTPTTLHI